MSIVAHDAEREGVPSVGLLARVRSSGFSGEGEVWVALERLFRFQAALTGLAEERTATLTSLESGALELRLDALDGGALLAVQLATAVRTPVRALPHAVTAAFEIDAHELEQLVAGVAGLIELLTRRDA